MIKPGYKHLYECNYDMPETSGIYVIINNINGHMYIGQAQYLPYRAVLLYHDHNRVLQDAYTKYGIENFRIELLEACPVEFLDEREVYWIKELHTYVGDPDSVGYNLTIGGRSIRGYKWTPDQLEKLSAPRVGNKYASGGKGNTSERTPEYRIKISESLKAGYASGAIVPYARTEPMKDEVKAKISAKLKGRTYTAESNQRRSQALKGVKKSKQHHDSMIAYRNRTVYHRVCIICSKEFSSRCNNAKYCVECKEILNRPKMKSCTSCGSEFTPNSNNQKYCNKCRGV